MRNLLDEKPDLPLRGRLRFTVAFVADDDVRGRHLLDIGCGFGWFELNALTRGAAAITGLEQSDADLQTINRCLHDPRLTTRVGSAIDLPFEAGRFDTVVSWEVLEHIPRRTEPAMFAEVQRVLRPAGRFYLSTPHANMASTLADPAWWLIGHRHYSVARLQALAAEAGFRVDRLALRGGLWELVWLWDLYLSKWVLRRRPLAEQGVLRRVDEEYNRPGFGGVFVQMTSTKNHAA